MHALKNVLRSGLGVLIVMALFGCAAPPASYTPPPNRLIENVSPGVNIVYRPTLRPGETFDSVKNDLVQRLTTGDVEGNDGPYFPWERIKSCRVLDNRIEIQTRSRRFDLRFDELINGRIILFEQERNGPATRFDLQAGKKAAFLFSENALADAERVADDLLFMQHTLRKQLDERLARFQPIALQYRALDTKPEMSEEQRRLIVQANALTQQKQYSRADEKYCQAIELDPVSYPEAYFNLALLEAQMDLPFTAIFHMKQYLMLVPDAIDARSAQDKIYEWEGMMQR